MPIRLTTLGAARVHRGDTAYPDLPAQRLRFALLVYLAVEQDVSRDEVVSMFWADRDTGRGKHALRQMLYELRQVLGEHWIEVRRDRIVASAVVDAIEFERAVEAGRTADALALYGGPFLLGFSLENRSFEAWVDRRGAHLARLHRRLQREHIGGLATAGRADEAVTAARQWVELDPLDDEAAHTLLERLMAAGQRTAALQFYDHYERQLAAELQLEPLDQTRALIASIRSGTAMAGPGPGSHRAGAPAHQDPAPAVTPGTLATPDTPATPGLPVPPADVQAAAGAERTAADRRLAAASGPGTHAGVPLRRGRPGRPGRTPRTLWRSASALQRSAALGLLAAAVLALALVVPSRGTQGSVSPQPHASVAILPFHDRSPDASLGPIAGELTDALARGLARSQMLDVISPNGVMQLRAEGVPEDTLGRMLGADYLVGGSVSRDGDQLRMDVELLDGRTGTVVRNESFDRSWSESRNLVEDVVRAAAFFLRGELSTRLDIERAQAGASNDEAWRLLLEGKAVQEPVVTLLEAGEFDVALQHLARADSIFATVARLDPRWVQPLLMRGWVLERRAFIRRFQHAPSADVKAELTAALDRAASAEHLGSDPAGVHELRGALLHQLALLHSHRDSVLVGLAAAEGELRRATGLNPSDQASWRRLADLLNSLGRYGEAKVAASTALRLDPYSSHAPGLTYQLFNTSLQTGHDREAEGWCFQGRNSFPGELIFVYCMLALHAWADGIDPQPDLLRQELKKLEMGDRLTQPQLLGRFETMIAAAYARAGQADSARVILERVAHAGTDPGTLWMRASAHALLGQDSIALALLDQHLDIGSWSAPIVATSRPFWDLLTRSDLERRIAARFETH